MYKKSLAIKTIRIFGKVEKIGDIEIRVVGKVGNQDLNPANNDIRQIAAILQNVEDLIYPNGKKDRPIITFDQQEGSVRHIFKTSMQAIIGFSALLTQVQASNSIDFLELKTARALESIQKMAREKNFEFQIKTSLQQNHELVISPNTNFIRTENVWVDAELELVDKKSRFDKEYLNSLINKAREDWRGIDADAWLYELRGGYEA